MVVAVDVFVRGYLGKDYVCSLSLVYFILVDCGIILGENIGIAFGVRSGDFVCGLEDFLLLSLEIRVWV